MPLSNNPKNHIFGLMLLFKKIQLKHFNLLLNFSDKYSYHIYLVHQLFILSPLTLMLLTPSYTTNILISIIVIVITGVLLQKISSIIIEFTSK